MRERPNIRAYSLSFAPMANRGRPRRYWLWGNLQLDREATEQTRLDCLGGFVVTQLYGLPDHGGGQVPRITKSGSPKCFLGVYKLLWICGLDAFDHALSKLERNIQRDRDDVKHLATPSRWT